ncbi:hypothetical protein LguiB_029414 [Lonicera macranthoides]
MVKTLVPLAFLQFFITLLSSPSSSSHTNFLLLSHPALPSVSPSAARLSSFRPSFAARTELLSSSIVNIRKPQPKPPITKFIYIHTYAHTSTSFCCPPRLRPPSRTSCRRRLSCVELRQSSGRPPLSPALPSTPPGWKEEVAEDEKRRATFMKQQKRR